MFSKGQMSSTMSKVPKPSKVKNEFVPYGFRTLDSFKDMTNSFQEREGGLHDNRNQTLRTERVLKEYYSNDSSVPSRLFYETIFYPNPGKKPTDK